jgi:hypothetical protein
VRSPISCCLAAASLVSLLAATPLWSAATVTYDPSLGTLPEAQGYAFANPTSAPLPSVVGGVLMQGPISASDLQYWHREDVSFAFDQGFSIEIRLQVVFSDYVPNEGDGSPRSGFYLEAIDTTGRRLTLGISSSGLTVNTDAHLFPSNGIPLLTFGTTDTFHDFKLFTNADSIYLFIDGTRRGAIPLGAQIFTRSDRVVYFGDGTSAAGSQVRIKLVQYSFPASIAGVDGSPRLSGEALAISPAEILTRNGVDLIVRSRSAAAVGVKVFDVRGAVVRDLGAASVGDGARAVHWDGIDATGNRARAGVYFATATRRGASASCKFVVLH